jgi:hypothetical protein
MGRIFSVYIAEKPYHVPELGDQWRRHRFLMLGDDSNNEFTAPPKGIYAPEQELHYVRMRQTGLLKAMVFPFGRVARPVSEIDIKGPVARGDEYTIRGSWNRALATGVALNEQDLVFADVTKISDISRLYTCDAGLQAGLDAMNIKYDFGRSGMFKAGLYDSVAGRVPALNSQEGLQARRITSADLLKRAQATRIPMRMAPAMIEEPARRMG